MLKNQTLPPLILAIDTSCDETSAAVTLGRIVLSNIIASQTEIHQEYGGVFPTLAKRAHQQNIKPVVKTALKRAGVKLSQLDAVAVTAGPGLAPALEVGIDFAKKLSLQENMPLAAINHIEAHALSVLAYRCSRDLPIKEILQKKESLGSEKPFADSLKIKKLASALVNFKKQELQAKFPVLAVVVSGGHTEFILVKDIGSYQILGQTIDDAAGEALDKVGRMLNLGYPAAPAMEELAKKGDKHRFQFPLPMTEKPNFNVSYSGLKTSAQRLIEELKADSSWNQETIIDFSASFQFAVFRHLDYKLNKLLQHFEKDEQPAIKQIWLGGGVARNIELRRHLRKIARNFNLKVKTPYEKRLCSDNAAMIGIAANFHYLSGSTIPARPSQIDKLDRRPNWPLDKIQY